MLKNPQDRRAKRTARQIKETMFSLMKEHPIHEIKVSEICRLCQINRATFYDHYRDVFDLVQDMEQDMLLAQRELMDRLAPEETSAEDVSRLFFAFLVEHSYHLNLLISSERSLDFCTRMEEQMMPFFEKKIRQNYAVPEGMTAQLRSVMEFVASGYYRFFVHALNQSHTEVSGEAELCARLSDACLGLLYDKKINNSSETE